MGQDRKIDYVEFPASDFDAIQSFYEAAFGWTFTDYGPEYRAFSDGRLNGGFYHSEHQSKTSSGPALVIIYANDLKKLATQSLPTAEQSLKTYSHFPAAAVFNSPARNGNELAVWSEK